MIHIVQCLCPKRHCIFAIAYDGEEKTDAQGIRDAQAVWESVKRNTEFNPWCGLCGSRTIGFEAGRTKFRTMEEAEPELRRNEALQLLSATVIRGRQARDN